jgi:hypothetical protein
LKRAIVFSGRFHCSYEGFVLEEIARAYLMVHQRNVHANNSPCANIQMTDFGITHDTRW